MKNGKHMSQFTVVLDRENDGRIIASVPGVPGCHAYGRSPSEAIKRVTRSLHFYLETAQSLGIPVPKQVNPVAVQVQVAV